MACEDHKDKEASFTVELRVNGQAIPGRSHVIKHDPKKKGSFVVSGSLNRYFNAGDTIEVWLTPQGNRKYKILQNGSSISIQKIRQF